MDSKSNYLKAQQVRTVMQINTPSKTPAAKWIASDEPLLDTISLEKNFLNFPNCLSL
jgi:hypothetical protein